MYVSRTMTALLLFAMPGSRKDGGMKIRETALSEQDAVSHGCGRTRHFLKRSGGRNFESQPRSQLYRGVQVEYYIAKTVSGGFPAIVERVIEALKAEGFGVLTEIDVKATMRKKLEIDFRDYRILGACNPPLAHEALTADDKIGTMLPCNVIVQDLGGGQIEVAAINPAVSMEHVGNPKLKAIAESVTGKLSRVIAAI